jgi:hypothetical protein
LQIFYFKLELYIGVESSDTPLNTKIPPILLFLRQTGCVCANRHLFQRTGLQKMRELYILCLQGGLVSPKGCEIRVAQRFGGFFSQRKYNPPTEE